MKSIETTAKVSRRGFNRLLAGAGAATLLTPAFANRAFASASDTIRIGWVGPRSGPLGIFGEADQWLTKAFSDRHAGGIEIGGKKWGVEVILADTQSDPVRASQETRDLINGQNPDIIIASATPETTNPVADACEAAGMPCATTVAPWEAWFFGRGGAPGNPFKWTFHFSFGAGDFAPFYDQQWQKIETNRKVGMLLPSDADGNAIRSNLIPALQALGWEVFDAGPYENMTSDFTNQINYFKQNGCEIVNAFPFPPDFPVFWRQAAQQGLAQQVKIMQMAKAGLFAAELEALGELGYGLASGAYWHKYFPTSSPSLGMTSLELADGFEAATGKQWTQQPGANAALFDVVLAALTASGNPKDKAAVASAFGKLIAETAVGKVDFANGPMPGVALTPLVGTQWMRSSEGPYPFTMEIVSNALAPHVSLTAELQPYRIGG
jgi:branched-chain amino acid transport system substrate-binding protein